MLFLICLFNPTAQAWFAGVLVMMIGNLATIIYLGNKPASEGGAKINKKSHVYVLVGLVVISWAVGTGGLGQLCQDAGGGGAATCRQSYSWALMSLFFELGLWVAALVIASGRVPLSLENLRLALVLLFSVATAFLAQSAQDAYVYALKSSSGEISGAFNAWFAGLIMMMISNGFFIFYLGTKPWANTNIVVEASKPVPDRRNGVEAFKSGPENL